MGVLGVPERIPLSLILSRGGERPNVNYVPGLCRFQSPPLRGRIKERGT